MCGQVDVAEPSLPQLLRHLVLIEAATTIEILAFGGVEDGLVLEVLEVVLEVLCAVRVE